MQGLAYPLDAPESHAPASAVRTKTRTIEWPTVAVALAIHGGWLALTWFWASIPAWLFVPVSAFVVAWHGSLQHETIHGHPTRSRRINVLVASLPIGLWLPYGIYRSEHLHHHGAITLTDPTEDPESFYVTTEEWEHAGALRRAWLRVQMTLAGRVVLGPLAIVIRFFAQEIARLVRGDRKHLRAWVTHLVGVALVIAWLFVCHLSILRYVACVAYPGMALSLLRSFAEHRPAASATERVAIVEAGPLASLLFLNNNLHVMHHDAPAAPWYELPARYRATRSEVLAANGNYVFRGYTEIIGRYAFRSKDSPLYPMG